MSDQETTGEDLIADFLEDRAIKFIRYPKIDGLKEDEKIFREADFYLPQYKVYVEFLGQWQNPDHQKRYKQKMAVYHKNKIPCVYLWPDNLGTLDWMLKRRIRETLLKYKMYWMLLKLEYNDYGEKKGLGVLLFIGLAAYNWQNNWRYMFLGLLLLDIAAETFQRVKKLKKISKLGWVSGERYAQTEK